MYYTLYRFETTNLTDVPSYECPLSLSMKSSICLPGRSHLNRPD